MMGTAVNYGLCRIENGSKRKWMHMGDNGIGAIMALCINLVLGLTRMALGE